MKSFRQHIVEARKPGVLTDKRKVELSRQIREHEMLKQFHDSEFDKHREAAADYRTRAKNHRANGDNALADEHDTVAHQHEEQMGWHSHQFANHHQQAIKHREALAKSDANEKL